MTINTRRKIVLKMNIDNKNKNKSIESYQRNPFLLIQKIKKDESRKYEKNQII